MEDLGCEECVNGEVVFLDEDGDGCCDQKWNDFGCSGACNTPTVEAAHGSVITTSPFGGLRVPSPPTIAMVRCCQASMPTTMALSIVSRLRDV